MLLVQSTGCGPYSIENCVMLRGGSESLLYRKLYHAFNILIILTNCVCGGGAACELCLVVFYIIKCLSTLYPTVRYDDICYNQATMCVCACVRIYVSVGGGRFTHTHIHIYIYIVAFAVFSNIFLKQILVVQELCHRHTSQYCTRHGQTAGTRITTVWLSIQQRIVTGPAYHVMTRRHLYSVK